MLPILKPVSDDKATFKLPQDLHANNITIKDESKGETTADWLWRQRLESEFLAWMRETVLSKELESRHQTLRFTADWRDKSWIITKTIPLLKLVAVNLCAELESLGYRNAIFEIAAKNKCDDTERLVFSVYFQPPLEAAANQEDADAVNVKFADIIDIASTTEVPKGEYIDVNSEN